jgi:hypothetical protein
MTATQQTLAAGNDGKVQRWRLFIDESGDFADLEGEVVVAGRLVPEGGPNSHPRQIRKALESAAAGLVWPLKTTELNQPVFVVLLSQHEGNDSALDSAADSVRRRFDEVAGEYLKTARAALGASRPSPHVALQFLQAVAWGHEDFTRIEDQVLEARALVGRCIGTMSADTSALGAMLIACGETIQGDVSQVLASDDETGRYLSLLEGVLERAVDMIARLPDRHEMLLEILDWDVSEQILGEARRIRLHHYRHVAPSTAPQVPDHVRHAALRWQAHHLRARGQMEELAVVLAALESAAAREKSPNPSAHRALLLVEIDAALHDRNDAAASAALDQLCQIEPSLGEHMLRGAAGSVFSPATYISRFYPY